MGAGSNVKRSRATILSFRMVVAVLQVPAIFWIAWQFHCHGDTTQSALDTSFSSHLPPIRLRQQGSIYQGPPSLSELTNTHNIQEKKECESKEFVYLDNIIADQKSTTHGKSRIPKIIHQTSKTKCVTKMFAQTIEPWRSLSGYDYYLHDDDAMIQLLVSQSDEFPLLHDLVLANCLPHGTLKADIWRYLVLYIYGGLYADLDTQPTKLFNTTIPILKDTDDGWFVVEQYHILSQWVMAVSPRHPLMYYAIHHASHNIMMQMDTKRINAALVTGPHALHRALQDFCGDAAVNVDPLGAGWKPVWAGTWRGTNQRSITVVGRGEFETEYIIREKMALRFKKKQYAKMNMTSFHEDKLESSGQSCLSALFQYQNARANHRSTVALGGR